MRKRKVFSAGSLVKEEEYDLDVIAFLCNSAGKVTDLGNVENGKPTLVNGDIIFSTAFAISQAISG